MPSEIYLGVCTPSNGYWRSEFGRSLAGMCMHFVQKPVKVNGVKQQRISNFHSAGSMLPQLRHNLTANALKRGCTHLLFIDSDMKFPADTANRLINADKDIIAANCTTRTFPTESVAHDLEGNRLTSKDKSGLQRVQHVGMAVMLIKREVFASLPPPLYLMDWIPDYNAYCGEDVYFCTRAQDAGYEIWVDHDLSKEIGHVGTYMFTHEDIEENDHAES